MLACYSITSYIPTMNLPRPTLLQMGAARRAGLALIGCALVWAALALALA